MVRPPRDLVISQAIEGHLVDVSNSELEHLKDRSTDPNISHQDIIGETGVDLGDGVSNVYTVQLDDRWENWFNRIIIGANFNELVRDSTQSIMAERDFDFNNLDWPVIGRAIGAALTGEMNAAGILNNRSIPVGKYTSELLIPHDILTYISDICEKYGLDITQPLPVSIVDDAMHVIVANNNNIDPMADISRVQEGPSSPLFRSGGLIWVNPFGVSFRTRMLTRQRARGGAPITDDVGGCVLDVINEALDVLAGPPPNAVDFAKIMHGVSAYMMQRSMVAVQKIGMHMFASFAVRREYRGVRVLLLHDLIAELRSEFSVVHAVDILQDHGILRIRKLDYDRYAELTS